MKCSYPLILLILLGLGCEPRAQSGEGTRDTDATTPDTARQAPRVHPIVDAGEGQLFGASRDGRWLSPDRTVGAVDSTRPYRLYRLTDTLGRRNGAAPTPAAETCRNPEVRISALPATARDVIGVAGDWNAMPRRPTLQDTTQLVYKAAVAAYLRRQDLEIEETDVRLDQVLRVDLEGNGREEVLIVSNRRRGSETTALANDYGLVLLRRVVDGRVRQRPLDEEYYLETCVAECAPSSFWIAAVLDANGDGTMEVVTGFRYFEGEGKRIYAVDRNGAEPVLSWRCGV